MKRLNKGTTNDNKEPNKTDKFLFHFIDLYDNEIGNVVH